MLSYRSILLWMIFFVGLGLHGIFQCYIFYLSYDRVTQPQSLVLSGCVASMPQMASTHSQFDWDTDLGKIRLAWWSPPFQVQPGDCLTLGVKIKPLPSFKNPGVRDPAFYQHVQGLVATGYVQANVEPQILESQIGQYFILRWRAYLLAYLQPFLSEGDSRGLIIDLLLGDNRGISQATWKILRNTGTSHLMAISGLHLGLIALLCMGIFRILCSLYPPLLERWVVPRLGWFFASALCTLYALVAGFSISTQRALVMLYAWTFSKCVGRTYTAWQIFKWTLLCVLLWDPLAIVSPGAWLSFTAVAWLIFVGSGYRSSFRQKPLSRYQRFKRWFYPQWVLTLGLIPLSLFFFSQATWVGLIANGFAIPWVGWIVVPLSLLALLISVCVPHVSTFLFSIVAWNLDQLIHLLAILSEWPGAKMVLPTPEWWTIPLAMMGLLILCFPRSFKGRWIGLLLWGPLLFHHVTPPPVGAVSLTVLDVGQGLSVVVRTHDHVLVYDTGTGVNMGFDAGARVVLPYLLGQGIRQIDVLVISHLDQDHSGGAAAVLDALPVRDIHSSDLRFHQGTRWCHGLEAWSFDEVQFRYFALPSSFQRNNGSCVLQIITANQSILLTGDIEKEAEIFLVQHYGNDLASNILVVPHHGSKTSSSLLFLKTVHPSEALIASGRFNRYHLPHSMIKKRYESLGIALFNTAEQGAILRTLDFRGALKIDILNRPKGR